MSLDEVARPPVILVVCTANICRSPLAQRALQLGFAQAGWLDAARVASAGTAADLDMAMCEVSAAQLGDGEIAYAEAHRSRPVTRPIVEGADLVLTAEREQRSAIARLVPGSQARVFTLKEAAALAEAAEQRILAGSATRPGTLAELAHLLHSMRGTTPIVSPVPAAPTGFLARFRKPPEPPDPLTIVDGHGREPVVHELAVDETRAIADRVAVRLAALI